MCAVLRVYLMWFGLVLCQCLYLDIMAVSVSCIQAATEQVMNG